MLGRTDKDRISLAGCKITRYIEYDLGRIGRKGIDTAIGRRNDRHIRSNRSAIAIERGNEGHRGAIRPQSKVPERPRRHYRTVAFNATALAVAGTPQLLLTFSLIVPLKGAPLPTSRVSTTRQGGRL